MTVFKNTNSNKMALSDITLNYMVGPEGLDGAAALEIAQNVERFAASLNFNSYEVNFLPSYQNGNHVEGEALGMAWTGYEMTEERAEAMAERFNHVRQYEAEHERGQVLRVSAVVCGRF